MKYYRLSILLVLLTLVSTAFAQNTNTISGLVQNEQSEPIAAASVFLMASTSNVIIKTGLTDDDGKYEITNVPNGTYYIEVTAVGMSNTRSEVFTYTGQPKTMDTLKMPIASEVIEGVTVTRTPPLVQNVNGKLVLNVENSSIAAGNTALDVLRRAPGVTVDNNDNILLMGREGINVTIDGRQTFMTGEQLATFLRSMDAGQIKSIEVGTTRTARDDAEGSAGSINIVLKKNNTEGFNGTFVASGAHGVHPRANTSASLNYKKNNTTLFGSYAFTRNRTQYDININRIITNEGEETAFDQDAYLTDLDRTHNYRVGIEQKTSERNTMVLQFSANNNRENSENNSLTFIGPPSLTPDSTMSALSLANNRFNRYSANFNNEFKTDTVGGKLTLDLDYTWFRNATNVDYEYLMRAPDGNLLYDPELERSRMPVDIDIYVARLDYVKPLSEKSRFETGLKYSNVRSDNDLQFEQLVDNQWIDFPGRPNHFVYTEQIAAGYVDYSRDMGKWALKAGLRGELTLSDGNSVSENSNVKREYFDLFPSASITHTIHENHILALSYARKISRPNYRYLNPAQYFIDRFTFMLGNPYLQPQYTHGFSLNYTLMKMFNFTLGSDITNDAMTESMGQDSITNETWITRENLGRQVTSYLNVNTPMRIGKFWTMNNNMTLAHMYFRGPIAGFFVDQGTAFFQLNNMSNYRINQRFSAESSLAYTAPFVYNVYQMKSRWGLDVGLTYSFKDQKNTLKLAATDIFRTNVNNISTRFNVFNSDIRQYNDLRTIRLTYTMKFGNLRQSARRNDRENEERSRAQ